MAGGSGGDSNWVVYFCALLIIGGALHCVLFSSPPSLIRVTVDSATLSRLTIVSNASASAATVSYHLAVRLKLYNPSDEASIYYDAMDTLLRFRGAVIGPAANDTSPTVFFQRSETARDVKVEFDYGRRRGGGVSVGGDVAAELEKGMNSVGTVTLELELDVRVRVRYAPGGPKLRDKLRIWCWMSIPVNPDGWGALASGDRCRVKN
ncbi:unnamed protein product [Urochloa humidicola]